ncbi:cytochrome c-type biogenesis protein CcmH [Idiomarina seosinensis]|uniref:cytochrome c-type biogenesis protein n=1 Tax=Idiomarina seosinensis TaxID=281739 RepID=UPI00384BF064
MKHGITPLTILLALLLAIGSASVAAQQVTYDGYEFSNPQQYQRYKQLTEELRCPKCQNQNIADSNAPLAEDMRERTYQMVLDGKSNEQIIQFMVARYGNFAHYRPPFNPFTAILWLAPLLIALLGIVIAVRTSRKRKQPVVLSEQEREQLQQLTKRSRND